MERIDSPNGRYYKTEHGTFPSVTTVLSHTVSQKKRAVLEDWQSRTLNSDQIFQDAGTRGTFLHRRVELALTGMSQPQYSAEEKRVLVDRYWKSLIPFVRKIKHPLYCERAVVNPEVGYAGTLDLLASHSKGSIACDIWDWKNGLRWKKKDWIEDYFLQISAYRVAAGYSLDPKPIVAAGHVVIALPDKEAQHFTINRTELNYYYNAFRRRVIEFRGLAKGGRVSKSATARMFEALGRKS
jgi:hypothetical protein